MFPLTNNVILRSTIQSEKQDSIPVNPLLSMRQQRGLLGKQGDSGLFSVFLCVCP